MDSLYNSRVFGNIGERVKGIEKFSFYFMKYRNI